MKAIYKRELKAYFTSFQAYIYLALFVCVTGIFFTMIDLNFGYNDFSSYVLTNSFYMIFVYSVALPILTMRMFAEEKKHKTDQLLLTSPVSVWEIVLGKYCSALTIYGIGILVITVFPVVIAMNGALPVENTISGYIGMILMAMCILAIGTLISSLTEEPVIAIIVSAVTGLVILLFDNLVSVLPDGAVPTFIFFGILVLGIAVLFYVDTKKIGISILAFLIGGGIVAGLYFWQKDWFVYGLTTSLNWLSILQRYQEFLNGILKLSTIFYLLGLAAFCLFASAQVIERRRWR